MKFLTKKPLGGNRTAFHLLLLVATEAVISLSQMTEQLTHASDDSQRAAMEALYGGGNLREIYDAVRDKKMSFAEFEKVVKSL